MISLFLGIAAFVLYLIYDINSYTCRSRFLHLFFAVGTVLLCAATGIDFWYTWRNGAFRGIGDILLLTGSALFFAALIYCLFFALPFEETYRGQEENRRGYSRGAYALCRHPGILCFFGMYLLLGLAALPTAMLVRCLVFSVLNLGYALFQDRVTFPKTFCDYTTYQKNVPFLIPTANSIRTALRTVCRTESEEEAK